MVGEAAKYFLVYSPNIVKCVLHSSSSATIADPHNIVSVTNMTYPNADSPLMVSSALLGQKSWRTEK